MKRIKCTTCDRGLPSNSFPKIPEGPNCEHERETCKRCWRQWLEVQVRTKSFDQISCAQCENILGQSEVRALAAPAVYQKYLDSEFKATLAADPDFRWCISPGCKSGQVHSEGDIFRCTSCEFKMCVHCNTPWHEEETCQAFQARLKIQPQEEIKSAEALKRFAKFCPGCDRKVQKNGGCDHIRCTQCRFEFCYLCLADYRRIFDEGNAAHKKSCPHWRHSPNVTSV